MHQKMQSKQISSQGVAISTLFASLLVAILLGAFGLWMPNQTPSALAQSTNEATIIVQLDDNARVVRSIEFTAPISGFAALQASGLSVVYTDTSFGPAVCSIEGVGCPATDCFCSTKYWGYNYWDGEAWQSYPVGAGSSEISQTGSIEGWRWGEWGDEVIAVTSTVAADNALTWLHARQSITNGGYGNMGGAVEALLAIGANHIAAEEWRQGPDSPSLANFVKLNGGAYTQAAVGAAGKTMVGLSAGDVCFPVGAVTAQSFFSDTLGSYSDQSGSNSWAILGTVAISESVPTSAVDYLREAATAEGGWEWSPGWGADTNTTALAIQALIAAGESVTSSTIISGLAFLDAAQNNDGGFPYAPGPEADSDSNSTAYVVQAIVAAGENPNDVAWTISNTSPITYLLSMQLPSGSFEWQPGTGENALATTQVIPALLGQSHPVAQLPLVACPALRLPTLSKQE